MIRLLGEPHLNAVFYRLRTLQTHQVSCASTAPQIRFPIVTGLICPNLENLLLSGWWLSLRSGYDGLLADVAVKCRESLKNPKPKLKIM